MPNKLLIVQNIRHEGPGLLEELVLRRNIATRRVDLSLGDSVPDPLHFSGMVVLGGPQSVNDDTPAMRQQLRQIEQALSHGIPYLGICLGMQALVKAAGGRVVQCPVPETGFLSPSNEPYRMVVTETGAGDALFDGLGQRFRVFQLHGETVELAAGTELIGRGTECPNQAVKVGSKAYGLQCHFEMTPASFSQWMEIDPSLKAMERALLFKQFNEVADEYRATGLRLLGNFLDSAGFGENRKQ
ncbi:type 1 glutamine amidotransferase [Chlorobium phaeovibrioides]|uniref:Type 1 glutamine amidotransferase n=1 Tax=Chlorobium phaeovibrioides TaxID=1094 RepID=A0A432AUU9_CHLPH|nr:type 1 glutamine amidotransferase [Chlorobium phaeovibrioides]RTY38402.1 type 1 glutamine amidotransferase [Chlorobium phaeovibrioides]